MRSLRSPGEVADNPDVVDRRGDVAPPQADDPRVRWLQGAVILLGFTTAAGICLGYRAGHRHAIEDVRRNLKSKLAERGLRITRIPR